MKQVQDFLSNTTIGAELSKILVKAAEDKKQILALVKMFHEQSEAVKVAFGETFSHCNLGGATHQISELAKGYENGSCILISLNKKHWAEIAFVAKANGFCEFALTTLSKLTDENKECPELNQDTLTSVLDKLDSALELQAEIKEFFDFCEENNANSDFDRKNFKVKNLNLEDIAKFAEIIRKMHALKYMTPNFQLVSPFDMDRLSQAKNEFDKYSCSAISVKFLKSGVVNIQINAGLAEQFF